MDVEVRRTDPGVNDTIGKLSINNNLACYTIEDEIRVVKVKGETCIPEGTYLIGKRWSPKFSPIYNHEMLWIKDVPGFEYILIHPGNTELDTEGCLLVGRIPGFLGLKRAVLDSKKTYLKIYKIISDAIDRNEVVKIKFINEKTNVIS